MGFRHEPRLHCSLPTLLSHSAVSVCKQCLVSTLKQYSIYGILYRSKYFVKRCRNKFSMTVFFILLRSPPFSKEKMPPPAYLFLAKQYRAKDGGLAACGFFWVVRRHGAPLVPRQRYEPNRRRAERRWRKGADGRISKKMPGRAGKSTVQKEKIDQKQKKMHLFGAKFRLTLWAICLIM